jgi:hypothetical protein
MLRRNSSQLLLACLYLLSVLALSMLFLHKTLQQQRELHNENPMAPMKGGGEGHLSAAGGERFSIYGMPARRQYPRRVGMGECPPLFGRIVVFMVVEQHMMPLSKWVMKMLNIVHLSHKWHQKELRGGPEVAGLLHPKHQLHAPTPGLGRG